jgi:hypothetical protein
MTCDRLERDGLLADLGGDMDPHVAGCPDCREKAASYARVTGAIAGEGSHALPDGWKERTIARIHAARAARRRRTMIVAGVGLAAAAAAVILLLARKDPTPGTPSLALTIVEGGAPRRGADAHPGQTIEAVAHGGGSTAAELRIYREGRDLLLRCPGGEPSACRRVEGGVAASYTIVSVGDHQIVWFVSPKPIPPPTGSFDGDVGAVAAGGGRVAKSETIHVY